MYHSKRSRKQKIVWDASDFIACISTDDQLFANQAGNLAGMDKEEEMEVDVQKAAKAQALHELHEIKTPQVDHNPALQFKKALVNKKKVPPANALTRYDVLSNMYALDKEDLDYCKREGINPSFLSWYFTNASRMNHDEFFSPSQLYFVGVDTKTFRKLAQHYEKKIKVYRDKFGYEVPDLAPNVARFRHVTNVPASYTCFFPRPPKVATRRKSQMESKVIEATFQIRQEVVNLHAMVALLITSQLEDMRFVRTIIDSNRLPLKNVGSSGEPKAKRFKKDASPNEELPPKVKALAEFMQDIDFDDVEEDESPLPPITDEFLAVSKKQAAILKVRSLFPETRPPGEQLAMIQQDVKKKSDRRSLLTQRLAIQNQKNKEKVAANDFEKYNEIEHDSYAVPAIPFFKKK